jgi:hypothetical protein
MKGLGKFAIALVAGLATASLADDKPKFPITIPEQHDRLGDGHHIRTTAVLSENGRLDVKTHLNSENIKGFHAIVAIFVLDSTDPAKANRLFATDVQTFGVNGKTVGDDHKRDESWAVTVPPEAMKKARGIFILHGTKNKPTITSEDAKVLFKEAMKAGAKVAPLVVG